MEEYKSIPAGAKAIELVHWGCGDDCCCNAAQIRAVFDDTHSSTPHYWQGKGEWSQLLWESSWFNTDGWGKWVEESIIEAAVETREACKHYGLEVVIGDDYWDWESRKELS